MSTPRLSVVIPVYNEKETVEQVIATVLEQADDLEVVLVDDCSTDGTRAILQAYEHPRVRIFYHENNRGKGAALRTGFEHVSGDIVVVQDADLEYDPREYPVLTEPIESGRADVVYGSRFLSGPHRVLFFWHYMGNKFLTLYSNMMTNLNLTDMETCYKAFTREAMEAVDIEQERFGIEPEITAKLARRGFRFKEVPISFYESRGYDEGKKIGIKDLFNAFWCIGRYGISD